MHLFENSLTGVSVQEVFLTCSCVSLSGEQDVAWQTLGYLNIVLKRWTLQLWKKLRPAVHPRCDSFVLTFNTFIINRARCCKCLSEDIFLFVCYLNCWRLVFPINHWCTKLKEGTKQLHGKSETDSLFMVTQLISLRTIWCPGFRVCFVFPGRIPDDWYVHKYFVLHSEFVFSLNARKLLMWHFSK